MEGSEAQATDASSIKPVSSLRSKFENLGQEKSAVHTNSPLQRSQLRAPGHEGVSRSPGRMSLDLPRPIATTHMLAGNNDSTTSKPWSRKRSASPPKQRPLSMVNYSPRQRSRSPPKATPKVTVESPQSPTKGLGGRAPNLTPNRSPYGSPIPEIVSPRTLPARFASRSSSPNISVEGLSVGATAASSRSRSPQAGATKSKSATSPMPPPVNRAGKPKVTTPPRGVSQSSARAGLGLDLDAPLLDNNRVSPFSTPPSSSENTPNEQSIPPPIDESTKPKMFESAAARNSYFTVPALHHFGRDRPADLSNRSLARSPTLPAQTQRQRASIASFQSHDERPNLPPRREGTTSGRTSPVKQQRIPARRSEDVLQRSSTLGAKAGLTTPPMRTLHSALSQGFNGPSILSPPSAQKPSPPVVPAPRRSLDVRRPTPPPPPPVISEVLRSKTTPRADDYEDPTIVSGGGVVPIASDFPDSSQASRRPPRFPYRPWEIPTGYDTRLCAVCGDYVCTTGYVTRVWSISTGETLLSLSHGENVKVTAMAWKPAKDVADEGKRLWLGTSVGDILEVDILTKSVVHTRTNAHPRREIVKMYRHASELWSLDDEGKLHVWRPGASGQVSLSANHHSHRVPRGHSFSLSSGDQLWIATGKEIRVFRPGAESDSGFQVLQRPLLQSSAGDVTSGATISSRPDEIYFGHADGKVSVYNRRDFSCLGVVNVSLYKISAMAGVGEYLWAGYNTGMAYVYDTSKTPWLVKKDWRAHENPFCSIITDQSSIWKMNRLQVVSLGTDNMLQIWDGMLEQDWLETQLQKHDQQFCKFREVTAAVMTWNAGASKPTYLKADERDNNFFRNYLSSYNPPDIFVFGFQELVDLEDKKVTAKSFFKSKKKDPSEQEHMSHQYRAWRDHLVRCLDDCMPPDSTYTVLHTASMVGLFSCIFVKTSLRARIKNVSTAEVKRGMGGLHGNKGALIIRMVLDDSSLCFVNCHLAAGQTQTLHRNNDIAAILESENLPQATNVNDVFTGGGDGSMILDHEVCILNGDLNYRIDAMTRDAVVKSVREKNLSKLLDRDQLLLSRKRNPGFRLRLFQEMPITFAPTYKYNVGTDDYDTSEKKRSPAWCDRLLYRGPGKVTCEDYRRWEVRVSDHRPVTALFRIRIKTVDPERREKMKLKTEKEFDGYSARVAQQVKLDYLTNVLGLPKKEASKLLQG